MDSSPHHEPCPFRLPAGASVAAFKEFLALRQVDCAVEVLAADSARMGQCCGMLQFPSLDMMLRAFKDVALADYRDGALHVRVELCAPLFLACHLPRLEFVLPEGDDSLVDSKVTKTLHDIANMVKSAFRRLPPGAPLLGIVRKSDGMWPYDPNAGRTVVVLLNHNDAAKRLARDIKIPRLGDPRRIEGTRTCFPPVPAVHGRRNHHQHSPPSGAPAAAPPAAGASAASTAEHSPVPSARPTGPVSAPSSASTATSAAAPPPPPQPPAAQSSPKRPRPADTHPSPPPPSETANKRRRITPTLLPPNAAFNANLLSLAPPRTSDPAAAAAPSDTPADVGLEYTLFAESERRAHRPRSVPNTFAHDVFADVRFTVLPQILAFDAAADRGPENWHETAHIAYAALAQHKLPPGATAVAFGPRVLAGPVEEEKEEKEEKELDDAAEKAASEEADTEATDTEPAASASAAPPRPPQPPQPRNPDGSAMHSVYVACGGPTLMRFTSLLFPGRHPANQQLLDDTAARARVGTHGRLHFDLRAAPTMHRRIDAVFFDPALPPFRAPRNGTGGGESGADEGPVDPPRPLIPGGAVVTWERSIPPQGMDERVPDEVGVFAGADLAHVARLNLFRIEQLDRALTCVDAGAGHVIVGDDAGGVSVWVLADLARRHAAGDAAAAVAGGVDPKFHVELVGHERVVAVSARVRHGEVVYFIATPTTLFLWKGTSVPEVLFRDTDSCIHAMTVSDEGLAVLMVLDAQIHYYVPRSSPLMRYWKHEFDLGPTAPPLKIRFDPAKPSMFAVLHGGEITLWDINTVKGIFMRHINKAVLDFDVVHPVSRRSTGGPEAAAAAAHHFVTVGHGGGTEFGVNDPKSRRGKPALTLFRPNDLVYASLSKQQ
ncbi:hypothetical protein H9P43_006537 [Blastocladiella emersonii ATCC 22665]|nr:hypothetical protein H9P43_006537 [Blastocladiella emersonii ATCC 22665]